MNFEEPFHVYTAANNIEAHVIADLLNAHGVEALAVEDQSGVSLWAFGTLSQFHRPKIWVDKPTAERARELIAGYEERQRQKRDAEKSGGDFESACEECGQTAMYAKSLAGTVQVCPHCGAFVDVGELDWEDQDFGEPADD